jgi:HTH-type transcriptional regulator, sugar sensing transcriptional regulator
VNQELGAQDFQRLWLRLQQIGLNAYEARSYLVLVGHPRFKALELASRAHVPRQKIYEVLDSLVEKGFAQVVQDRTKLFSAVEPELALCGYVARQRQQAEQVLVERGRLASGLMEDLVKAYPKGKGERGTLDYLKIIGEPAQSAAQYSRMLADTRSEYLEFLRPPYAFDPLDDQQVLAAGQRGVACRVLIDTTTLDERRLRRLQALAASGVQVHQAAPLPLKMALFDGVRGLIALLDPVITKPVWTALQFDHAGLGEAMKGLFEQHWKRSEPLRRRE